MQLDEQSAAFSPELLNFPVLGAWESNLRDVGITRKKVMRCYTSGRNGIIQNGDEHLYTSFVARKETVSKETWV
jgi:hypothetical protein